MEGRIWDGLRQLGVVPDGLAQDPRLPLQFLLRASSQDFRHELLLLVVASDQFQADVGL